MSAVPGVPQPFPYQGSKRQLAKQIVACLPSETKRLVEPFAGSAAVSLAAAHLRRAHRFFLNDAHEPLIKLWKKIVAEPEDLAKQYKSLWQEQSGQEREYYDLVRQQFNESNEPHFFLYLLARCVKAAVRYNGNGKFNNSPDNRRLGMRPETMGQNIRHASALLRGRVRLTCQDYRATLREVNAEDVVYMDPPYQGVCATRDHRYCSGVTFDSFVESLDELNRRGVAFLVSYDGRTGDKVHGRSLPAELDLVRLDVKVGRSTQATLLGRKDNTVESLYLSSRLLARLGTVPDCLKNEPEPSLFGDLGENKAPNHLVQQTGHAKEGSSCFNVIPA
ncbi:MAG: DNA adenine methylase [Gemmataceae bacterium]